MGPLYHPAEQSFTLRKLVFSLTISLSAVLLGAVSASASTLHPGDKVSVTVYNHPELSLPTVTLDALGQASVPLAGLVGQSGETPSKLAATIRERLMPYVRHPAVDVQLLAQGPNIFVSGGPGGVLTYTPGETLSAALSQLGSPQVPNAVASSGTSSSSSATEVVSNTLQYAGIDLRHVVVMRDGVDLPAIDVRHLNDVGDPGPLLRPDDTIKLVHKVMPVTVEGEVYRPGVVYLDRDEPLSDALLQAGGPDEKASAIKFSLTRDGQRVPVSTSSPQYQAPAEVGDVIYVPHSVRIGVVGQVIKPGDVELRGDDSLLSALYFAGGPTKYGDIKHVALIHQGVQSMIDVTRLTHGAPLTNPQLSDGDTVFVPEGHKIDFALLFQGLVSATYLRFL